MSSYGGPIPPRLLHQASSSLSDEPSNSGSWPPSSTTHAPQDTPRGVSPKPHYEYISGAYKMLSWPFVQSLFEASDFESRVEFASIPKEGPAIMLGVRPHSAPLPLDTLSMDTTDDLSALDPSIGNSGKMGFGTASLNWDTIHRQSKAYFDTFNLLYPIIDRQSFQTQVLPVVTTHGFDESINSTLALLVLSLGEVAIGSIGEGTSVISQGRPSGLKGGSPGRPPGLLLFNEARKRMGFNLTECSIENVQIFALAA